MPEEQKPDNSNNNRGPLKPSDTLPKVVQTIEIRLHANNMVTATFPTHARLVMNMLSQFMQILGSRFEYKEPSQIVQPPKGLVIPGRS